MQQILGVEGLREVVIRPFFGCFYCTGNRPVGSKDDDRKSHLTTLQMFKQRNAVHSIHFEIKNCKLRALVLSQCEGIYSSRGQSDSVPGPFEADLHQRQKPMIIVYN